MNTKEKDLNKKYEKMIKYMEGQIILFEIPLNVLLKDSFFEKDTYSFIEYIEQNFEFKNEFAKSLHNLLFKVDRIYNEIIILTNNNKIRKPVENEKKIIKYLIISFISENITKQNKSFSLGFFYKPENNLNGLKDEFSEDLKLLQQYLITTLNEKIIFKENTDVNISILFNNDNDNDKKNINHYYKII